jgi:dihydroorotate dehydrogenase
LNENCDRSLSPLFLKIAPDILEYEFEQITELCLNYSVSGIVATNITNSMSRRGGVSGAMLSSKANSIHQKLLGHPKLPEEMDIIYTGGLYQREQVQALQSKGARFFQIYSSFVFEGPKIVSNLC